MIKGETTIELFDGKTGELVEKVTDTNMVTNWFYDMIQPKDNESRSLVSTGNACHNVEYFTAGVMCFSSAIEEDADNYIPTKDMICTAHARRDVTYSDTELSFGSWNSNSSDITNQRTKKYVWDWNLDQGNGTIASVCLTSEVGGAMGWNNNYHLSTTNGDWTTTTYQYGFSQENVDKMGYYALEIYRPSDFEYDSSSSQTIFYSPFDKKCIITSNWWDESGSRKVYFAKYALNPDSINIFDFRFTNDITWESPKRSVTKYNANDLFLERFDFNLTELFSSTFSIVKTTDFSGYAEAVTSKGTVWFLAYKDDYYGHTSRVKSGNKIYGICINATNGTVIDTFQLTVPTFDNNCNYLLLESGAYFGISAFAIFNNHLYGMIAPTSLDGNTTPLRYVGINLSTGDWDYVKDESNNYVDTIAVVDDYYWYDSSGASYHRAVGYYDKDNLVIGYGASAQTNGGANNVKLARLINANNPHLAHYCNMSMTRAAMTNSYWPAIATDCEYLFANCSYSVASEDQRIARVAVTLKPNYLFTINNLSSPVTKTADKTMRITYTITDATED